MVFKKLSAEEERLAKMWFQEDGKTPAEIAELLRRDKSTMTRLLVKKVKRKRDGRPVLLTKTQVDVLVTTLKSMIKKANCKYMVTAKDAKACDPHQRVSPHDSQGSARPQYLL